MSYTLSLISIFLSSKNQRQIDSRIKKLFLLTFQLLLSNKLKPASPPVVVKCMAHYPVVNGFSSFLWRRISRRNLPTRSTDLQMSQHRAIKRKSQYFSLAVKVARSCTWGDWNNVCTTFPKCFGGLHKSGYLFHHHNRIIVPQTILNFSW